MKHIAFIILIFLSGCSITGNVVQDRLQIGGIFALTGPGASWGNAERNAVELAFEQANAAGGINGTKITLQTEDSQTSGQSALSAYQRLSNDGREIIIGPTWEASASTVAPAAHGTLVIAPSAYKSIKEQNQSTYFSTYPPLDYEITAIMPFLKEHSIKRVAIIYNDEAFSVAMKDIFVAQAQDVDIVGVHQQSSTDADFRTVLLKIKEEKVDAVYAPLAKNDPDMGIFMKQLHELNMDTTVISISSTENPGLMKNYGRELEGILYPFPQEAMGYTAFSEQYKERYGELPRSPSAATAYDAANMLIAALRTGAKTPTEIAQALRDIKEYPGASNTITFLPDGTITSKRYVIKTVHEGRFADYAPVEYAQK